MRKIALLILLFLSVAAFAQKQDTTGMNNWKTLYRATPTKINDLVHTKLEVRFDYAKCWMYGKAWITLHPHFYPTDSLNLDAKGMVINEISLVKGKSRVPLKFTYDSLNLYIKLDKTYKASENYTVYVDYISRPNEIKSQGSMAITSAKGLYFINPDGKDKNKPIEIWTQGETESNSVWVPIIDKPDQKTTDEISMTVPAKYVTLSNGLLVSKKMNADGTRTDTWNMNLPHAPYLMMMAVGDYAIIKDHYKNKEVNYYVEKEYAPVARKIFGLTPEMIAFYSRITGVDYPWQKYDQIVARDYVSGAMENTTATLHGEYAQQDARQLIDGNGWETVIAHELFHMWFGDYVTTESWSNLAINESFADYSETLWEEYKYGKDAGDAENYQGMQTYLRSGSDKKDLVRFYYRDKEDMFDAVSYQKGGCILHMLRNAVGDSAFFKSLNLFLTRHKFQAVEVQQLRLAFEEVTGRDMNWFFNQWFYGSGHPRFRINYSYDQGSQQEKVVVSQIQSGKVFSFPTSIDVYLGNDKKRFNVWVTHRTDTFTFPATREPELVNFDGDKVLLCEKTENKTIDNYIFQYQHAGLYLDRREAIDFASRNQRDAKALRLLTIAMKDPYFGLRRLALQRIYLRNDSLKKEFAPILLNIAKSDPKTVVRADAIDALGSFKDQQYKTLFLDAVKDSSYAIAASGLRALSVIDTAAALKEAEMLNKQNLKGELKQAITNLLYTYADEGNFDDLAGRFDALPFGSEKFSILQPFANFLKRVKNPEKFKAGIDMIIRFRDAIPEQYRANINPYINGMVLNGIASSKQNTGSPELADYVKGKIGGPDKPKTALELPADLLRKYAGDYEYNGATLKINLKDNKSLTLGIQGQQEIELVPVSRTKFNFKFIDGYSVEFNTNDKGEVTGLTFEQPTGTTKATRKTN